MMRNAEEHKVLPDIHQALQRYVHRVPIGYYTADSKLHCTYNILYHLHLQHSLGHIEGNIVDQIRSVADTQEQDGFLSFDEQLVDDKHDLLYARLHKSALFFQLADAYHIDIRLPTLEAYFSEQSLKSFLADIDFSRIWFYSNIILGIATASQFCHLRGHRDPYLEIIVEFLQSTEQTAQSLWGFGQGASCKPYRRRSILSRTLCCKVVSDSKG